MNRLDDLSVVLTGNPVLSAVQISNLLTIPHKDLELVLPLLRGMVHIFDFDINNNSDDITYQINLLLETEGRESIIMTYINSIMEDVFMTIENNSSASAVRLLDKCIEYIVSTFKIDEQCSFVYNKSKNILGKSKITYKMIEEFKNTDMSIDIEPLYLAQHARTTPIVKIYNAMYVCLKTYINKGIQTLLIYGEGKADSKNNCITIEGKLDNIVSFYRFLMYHCANLPVISQLIDTVKITTSVHNTNLPTDINADKFMVVLPNVNVDSMTYLRCIMDTNYMVYMETMDKYKKDKEETENRIKILNSLVDNSVATYFLIDCNLSGSSLDNSMILADSLSVSDSIPALTTLIGNIDVQWVDDEYDYLEPIAETDEEAEIVGDEFVAEDGLEVRKEKISEYGINLDLNVNIENIDLALLNKELTKVGLNGYQAIPHKIIKWGEQNTNVHIQPAQQAQNTEDQLSTLQYITIDNVPENIYIFDDTPLPTALPVHQIHKLVEQNQQDFLDAIPDRQVIPEEVIVENAGLIETVFNEISGQVREMVSDISTREQLEVLFCQIMLGDFSVDITSKIIRNLNRKTLKEIFGGDNKIVMARYKQLIVKAIITILMNSARTYRLENSKLKNNKLDFSKFKCTDANLSEIIDYVFG